MCIIKILNNIDRYSWQRNSIISSLAKINLPYTIGIIDREHDNIIDDINVCDITSDIDVILILRCDHMYDRHDYEIEKKYLNLKNLNLTIPTIIIKSTDINYYYTSIKYPIWFTIVMQQMINQNNEYERTIDVTNPKKYIFSSISNKVTASRLVNYLEFQNSTYYNKSLLTLNSVFTIDVFDELKAYWGDDYADMIQRDIFPNLPIKSNDVLPHNPKIIFDYYNSVYLDSYVNVITETYYTTDPFISEKIIKSILAKQFFVVIGGRNTIKYLRQLGFDMFDDIINHSFYDSSHEADRIKSVHVLLNQMQHYDWIQIYQNTEERREKNRQKVLTFEIESKFLQDLILEVRKNPNKSNTNFYNKNFELTILDIGSDILNNVINESVQNQNIVILSVSEYYDIDQLLFLEKISQFNITIMILTNWSGFETLTTTTDHLPLKTIFLDNNFTKFNVNQTNHIFYPHWLFYTRRLNPAYEIKTEYLFSCANRNFNNGRPSKIYNYQMLKNKPYFNQILYSKFRSIEEFELFAIPELVTNNMKLVDSFLDDYNTWPQMNYNELELMNSVNELDLDVYKKSLFHIIAETSMIETHLSEKTFKVFAAHQIPIMCGPANSIKHLRDLGFDVFDDIIDHWKYDNIEDWQQRIHAMHNILDDIAKLDHNKILIDTEIRRRNNFKKLLSEELTSKMLTPIITNLINLKL